MRIYIYIYTREKDVGRTSKERNNNIKLKHDCTHRSMMTETKFYLPQ
jgi:hypothetical protein